MAAEKTMLPRSWRRTKSSRQAGLSGSRLACVMAMSRPLSASRASADDTCRSAASVRHRSTLASAENGGFIGATVGVTPGSRPRRSA